MSLSAARAHWRRFLAALMELSADDIGKRFATADRHIRDTGVSYRAYGDTSERAWPLSHVPLLIEAGEWREIARGIEQRARLLELVLADICGEGRLIAAGDLPAAAITGSPEFLHPLHGVNPPGGKFLHIYAADIGRGPDGRWWVLGDRSQAPSGVGYAFANRLVLARAFPALYRDMNVERLAPFFEAFRFGLTSMAQRSNPRICLLTPGPFNETYFEQAYLARYLGLLLVEGGDLTMRDGKVHVRTIAGLKRADVIWRRIDSDFADPLELNARSRLGVPGLVDALREGGVVIANALGSGVLEAPAMMSFMPKLCRTCVNTCRFARHFASGDATADDLDVLLDFVDSQITYRSRYLTGVALNPVRDMVVLDSFNPRSVAFQVERLDEHLETLPLLSDDGMLEAPRRLILQLAAEVATATASSLDNEKILGFEQSLLGLADAIAARYFLQGPHVARADKSSGLA